MAIELNKVGVEIDGKVYQFYKMSFGFQRKLVEIQSQLNELTDKLAKKYNITPDEVTTGGKLEAKDQLELTKLSLELTGALSGLFVNKDEASILDNFDSDNAIELMQLLQ